MKPTKFYSFRRFLSHTKGASFVEFALIFPVVILIVAGIFELTLYALLNQQLAKMAGALGSTITLQSTKQSRLQAILNTAPSMVSFFNFAANGNVIVSHIRSIAPATQASNQRITWQMKYDATGLASQIGSVGAVPANLPNGFFLTGSQTYLVIEARFSYRPLVFTSFFSPRLLNVTTIFVPRVGDMTTFLAE